MSEVPPGPGAAFEEAGADVAADHAAAEGAPAEANMGAPSTLRDMLLSTEPSEPLSAVESPWDPANGGPRRLFRGLKKMTGVEGMPAVVDVVIGALEIVVEQQGKTASAGEADAAEEVVDLSDFEET